MFSGYGSQYYHMAETLYNNNSVFKKYMDYFNEQVVYCHNNNIIEVIYNSKKKNGESIEETKYVHPAMFMIQYSIYMVFYEMGIKPDFVLGSSLGEIIAYAVAGVIDLKEIFDIILYQTKLIDENGKRGGMIAILEDLNAYNKISFINKNSYLASINYDSHFVVSSKKEQVSLISDYLHRNDIMHINLPVEIAFHSPLIDNMQNQLISYAKTKKFKKAKIPIVSCSLNKVLNNIDYRYFWYALRNQVKFYESIKLCENKGENIYIDLGPLGTLASFVNKILPYGTEVYSIITPFKRETENISKIVKRYFENNEIY